MKTITWFIAFILYCCVSIEHSAAEHHEIVLKRHKELPLDLALSPESKRKEIRSCEYKRSTNLLWFYWCDFSNIDMSGKNLSNTNFAGSNFSNTSLVNANLSESRLTRSNIAGANFEGANLSHAILLGVDLNSANFKGANLSGAIVAGHQICSTPSVGSCVLSKTETTDSENIISILINHPKIRDITRKIGSPNKRKTLIIKSNEFVRGMNQLVHVGLPVKIMNLGDIKAKKIGDYLTISKLDIFEGKAVVGYTYYSGGKHSGTFDMRRIEGRWVLNGITSMEF